MRNFGGVRIMPDEKMTWRNAKAQFKQLVAMVAELEQLVLSQGRVPAHQAELMATTNALSSLSMEVLNGLIAQSEVILVQVVDTEGGKEQWYVRNPEYLVEEEITLSRTITDRLSE